MEQSKLIIFCDGGVGNRINSLLAGLAIAKYFKLEYTIHWPVNNWCAAEFNDIFQTLQPISLISIKDLKGKMNDSIMLLHDDIASTALGVNFASAYDYKSMEDFQNKVLSIGGQIFFYPALMPEWVPMEQICNVLKELKFTQHIIDEVTKFIKKELKTPFYGIHLRRTDLTVGLTDLEVHALVSQNRDAVFFVCSDEPLAEKLACAHPNVHSRSKNYQVEKKVEGDWNQLCADDEGRIYNSNIHRGSHSVVEATIDMLILAQSEIIGFSGSTFQRMARLIGDVNPVVAMEKPGGLRFVSNTEVKRQLKANVMSLEVLMHMTNSVGLSGNYEQAIDLLEEATSYFSGNDLLTIYYNLAIYHLNKGQSKIAQIYFNYIVVIQPDNVSSWLHLSYTNFLLKNIPDSRIALENYKKFQTHEHSNSEQMILNLLLNEFKEEIS